MAVEVDRYKTWKVRGYASVGAGEGLSSGALSFQITYDAQESGLLLVNLESGGSRIAEAHLSIPAGDAIQYLRHLAALATEVADAMSQEVES